MVLVTGVTGAGVAVGLLAVPLVFGSEFAPSVRLGLLLVPGVAIFGLGNVFAAHLTGCGRAQLPLLGMTLVVPPTLVGYFLIIPKFGVNGAAVAASLSYAATGIVLALLFFQVFGRLPLRQLVPRLSELRDYRWLLRRILRRGSTKR
jgi:O-antigen/teichoic acid export membrane protein